DEGSKLVVLRGAKGGRPRTVDFDTDPAVAEWQRDVLERAKKIAQRHPKRRLALPGLTLQQSRRRYYLAMEHFGITQKELGVTSHGLRHQFAARRFEALAGLPTMASGQAPLGEYRSKAQEVEQAQLDVSQQLGHWRKDVTSSYLGSVGALGRETQKRMRSWLELVEGNPLVVQALSQSGVKEAWIGGRAAMGLPLAPSEKLTLVVRMDLGPDTQERMDKLASRLNKRIARGVSLMLHIQPGVPADGLEILIRGSAAGERTN
ncbi:integrase domain-containing protein, partial [Arthrospira platensis SPKY1]|nr:integrase domain-containing protein [Arthrospira platensis SPKY1]